MSDADLVNEPQRVVSEEECGLRKGPKEGDEDTKSIDS